MKVSWRLGLDDMSAVVALWVYVTVGAAAALAFVLIVRKWRG